MSADYLSAFNTGQLQALALASIRLRTFGFDVAFVFFGFHCLIVGYLLFRSTFVPRILGIALQSVGLVISPIFLQWLFPPPLKTSSFPT